MMKEVYTDIQNYMRFSDKEMEQMKPTIEDLIIRARKNWLEPWVVKAVCNYICELKGVPIIFPEMQR